MSNVVNLINSHPLHAIEALKNVYHHRVYVVWSSHDGRIARFCKTRKGAESYVKKEKAFSYYDEYLQRMVTCGNGLEIAEVKDNQIADPTTDKKMWYKWLRECLPVPHMAQNVVTNAKHYGVSDEVLAFVEEIAKEIMEKHSMPYIEEYEREEETEMKTKTEEKTETDNRQESANVTASYNLNDELNGIEITFSQKPDQSIIDMLKEHGFRWSKRGFWYAKQSPERIAFVQSLCGNNSEAETEQDNNQANNSASAQAKKPSFSYPEIDIDDIHTYVVPEDLQRRENDAAWIFRTKPFDHTKDIQAYFTNYQNKVLDVLNKTDNQRIIYYLKKELQRFKKKYFDNYLKRIKHLADNPSWVVTGPSGRNSWRDEKMSRRFDKLMREGIELTKQMDQAIKSAEWEILRENREKQREAINSAINSVQDVVDFKTETREITMHNVTERVRAYVYGPYMIAKTWGTFRIFKDGKQIHAMKTNERLEDAKKYVSYLVKQEQETA